MSSSIENPILNSPYEEPTRYYRFDDDGITNKIVDGRRRSSYFIPIPPPRKKGKLDDARIKGKPPEAR